jgi:3-deoxy-manno-octulosonate cytidylyltransferase (CMP-KDO synthetase)
MSDSALPKNVVAIIPARYASSRFPGKPLASIANRPMIQHVVERVRSTRLITRVVVATDDERIQAAVKSFGGEALLTRPDHHSGTDRVAEVAAQMEAEIYVNVQGDEPLVDPETIDALVSAVQENPEVRIATPCSAILQPNDIMDPNVVKVVRDFEGNALYFSRAPVPWVRDTGQTAAVRHWKHLGLYAFRRDALREFPTLPPGDLERVEQLEQLRWLENGFRISMVETDYDAVSVDVPGDIERVEKMLQEHA